MKKRVCTYYDIPDKMYQVKRDYIRVKNGRI